MAVACAEAIERGAGDGRHGDHATIVNLTDRLYRQDSGRIDLLKLRRDALQPFDSGQRHNSASAAEFNDPRSSRRILTLRIRILVRLNIHRGALPRRDYRRQFVARSDKGLVGVIGNVGRDDGSIDFSAGFGIAALKGCVTHGKPQIISLEVAGRKDSRSHVI